MGGRASRVQYHREQCRQKSRDLRVLKGDMPNPFLQNISGKLQATLGANFLNVFGDKLAARALNNMVDIVHVFEEQEIHYLPE